MKERAAATVAMWAAIALIIERLISSIRYTELMPLTDGSVYNRTAVMSGEWQVAVVIMVIFIALMGALATSFLWDTENTNSSRSEEQTRRHTEKIKRERRERVARLLETMDEDELAALEDHRLSDDGELLSIQEVLDPNLRSQR